MAVVAGGAGAPPFTTAVSGRAGAAAPFPRVTGSEGEAGGGAAPATTCTGGGVLNPGCRTPSMDSKTVSAMVLRRGQVCSSVLRTKPVGTSSLVQTLVTMVQAPLVLVKDS